MAARQSPTQMYGVSSLMRPSVSRGRLGRHPVRDEGVEGAEQPADELRLGEDVLTVDGRLGDGDVRDDVGAGDRGRAAGVLVRPLATETGGRRAEGRKRLAAQRADAIRPGQPG